MKSRNYNQLYVSTAVLQGEELLLLKLYLYIANKMVKKIKNIFLYVDIVPILYMDAAFKKTLHFCSTCI